MININVPGYNSNSYKKRMSNNCVKSVDSELRNIKRKVIALSDSRKAIDIVDKIEIDKSVMGNYKKHLSHLCGYLEKEAGKKLMKKKNLQTLNISNNNVENISLSQHTSSVKLPQITNSTLKSTNDIFMTNLNKSTKNTHKSVDNYNHQDESSTTGYLHTINEPRSYINNDKSFTKKIPIRVKSLSPTPLNTLGIKRQMLKDIIKKVDDEDYENNRKINKIIENSFKTPDKVNSLILHTKRDNPNQNSIITKQDRSAFDNVNKPFFIYNLSPNERKKLYAEDKNNVIMQGHYISQVRGELAYECKDIMYAKYGKVLKDTFYDSRPCPDKIKKTNAQNSKDRIHNKVMKILHESDKTIASINS
jgi:hypothetical protein